MTKKNYEIGEQRKPEVRRGPGPNMGGEKAKNFRGAIGKIIAYSPRNIACIIIVFLFSAVSSVLTLLGPNNLSEITNLITSGIEESFVSGGGADMDAIFSIGLFLAIVYATSYILSIVQGLMMATAMQTTAKQLRSDISTKINDMPMGFFYNTSKGDILSRVTNDVDILGQTLSQSFGTLITSLTLLVGSTIMMLITNWILALTAIGAALIGFILMLVVMKTSQKHFKSQQSNLGSINGHIEEVYAGHTIVKAYNNEKIVTKIFSDTNDSLRKSAFSSQALSGLMMPIMTFIGNFGYVCVCVVGSVLAYNGIITLGTIVAFMVYTRLFTQPLSQIAQATQNMQSGAAASERVFDFLAQKEMDKEVAGDISEETTGKVEFKNVQFGYEADKIIIKNFSLLAKPGQKIAIVGPTGAGKTTLVNLLMRFYEINAGQILIDDKPISEMTREQVRNNFCMVLQDTWLFEGTLRENIVYSTKNVSDEKLDEACNAVGLHHFVKTLAKGYDTVLNDSMSLSQGQKQQITIARAMLADRPMLILDEATSSVDTRTELHIQDAMDALMIDRTSFVIAHRLSTIKNADLILVIKDGDIIETGTHEQLLDHEGYYAELYQSQFQR